MITFYEVMHTNIIYELTITYADRKSYTEKDIGKIALAMIQIRK